MTNYPADFLHKAQLIQQQILNKDFHGADSNINLLLADSPFKEELLRLKIQLLDAQGEQSKMLMILKELAAINPHNISYALGIAGQYQSQDKGDAALAALITFKNSNPKDQNIDEHLGDYYLENGQHALALEHFDSILANQSQALDTIWCKKADVYQQQKNHLKAKTCYEHALNINAANQSARCNLASLFEQEGNKQAARTLYNEVLDYEPRHPQALYRLSYLESHEQSSTGLARSIKRCLRSTNLSNINKEGLHFALGKIYEDCEQYDEAYEQFCLANALGKERVPAFDKEQHANKIESIIQRYATDRTAEANNEAKQPQPVFICGMFRSGTTLVEQILVSHSQIDSAGEMHFFIKQLEKSLAKRQDNTSTSFSAELATDFITLLNQKNFTAPFVIDKRPDNTLAIGLIKAVFPQAKIICLNRHPFDIGISIFAQQLSETLNYATELDAIHFYYNSEQRLQQHWKNLYQEQIYFLDYEQLVDDFENQCRLLFAYLNLNFEPACLNFFKNKQITNTASVWQVRQPIHKRSVGRWQNYKKHFKHLDK